MRRLAVIAALALAFPATASAHATLEHTVPTEQGRVTQAPRLVRLNFDQSVTPLANSIAPTTWLGTVTGNRVPAAGPTSTSRSGNVIRSIAATAAIGPRRWTSAVR